MSTRCGYAAILGAPNAGKSTLLNRLAAAKVAIVTPKPQTTRARILGIVTEGESQILLVDTPGIFRPRRALDRAMVGAAWAGAATADLILFVIDAVAGLTEAVHAIGAKLPGGVPVWLVLNQIDRLKRPLLLPLAGEANAAFSCAETFMISAATGDGVSGLRTRLAGAMPEGPFLYPPAQISDMPERLFAAEIVREQVFLQTRQEVPYETTVETTVFRDQKDGSTRIEAVIYVSRPGLKSILLGARGARIRAIGTGARGEIEAVLGRKVHLFLHVKEWPDWDEEPARLAAIGLGGRS